MYKVLNTVVIINTLLFLGCGDGLDAPKNEEVKGGELFVDFKGSQIKPGLIKSGLIDENQTVYGYKAYKIPYTTSDEEGHEVEVSGLFVVPQGLPNIVTNTLGLSLVADDHGTIFANKEAPSVMADETGTPAGSAIILTSLGGFATLQPDYIGFGDSNEHYHPFVLKDSLANATVDFIQQVKIFAKDNNIILNNQLFLTGYSEGGYAAMATLKKIEEEQLLDLKVTMAAPMAGPYALKIVADSVLSQPKLSVPSFMANVAYAYGKVNTKALNSIINQEYASKLPTLFNGNFTREEIDAQLTTLTATTPNGNTGLFQTDFIVNYFTVDDFWFKEAAKTNSLHNWVPTSPVRLIHCEGDDVIPYKISVLTETTMQALGAPNVLTVPVEQILGLSYKIKHAECASLAYIVTTKMFATTRRNTIGY